MQITISSDDPIDKVVAAVEAVFGVEVTVRKRGADPRGEATDTDGDQGITRPRPT